MLHDLKSTPGPARRGSDSGAPADVNLKITDSRPPVLDNILTPMLIGRSPFEYEVLWMQMFNNNIKYGASGPLWLALSAVDFALWDLLGKTLNVPIWRLLGGKFRDKMEVSICKAWRRWRTRWTSASRPGSSSSTGRSFAG